MSSGVGTVHERCQLDGSLKSAQLSARQDVLNSRAVSHSRPATHARRCQLLDVSRERFNLPVPANGHLIYVNAQMQAASHLPA
jgi:hypothetical protein